MGAGMSACGVRALCAYVSVTSPQKEAHSPEHPPEPVSNHKMPAGDEEQYCTGSKDVILIAAEGDKVAWKIKLRCFLPK